MGSINLETQVIGQDEINKILGRCGFDRFMDLVIDRLHEAFVEAHHNKYVTPTRAGFRRCPRESGVLEWMPHHEPERAITIKTVAYTPANPSSLGLPTILGSLTRFDDITGHLTAICDGVLLTAVRTGAASAVASRLLAHCDSQVLGLIGAGAQAVTQLHALSRVFPIERVLVYDIEPAHSATFPARVERLQLDVRVAKRREIESLADIICTATSVGVGQGPVLHGTELKEHMHINAIGADLPGKTELPGDFLRSVFVYPDHLEQAINEGECQQLPRGSVGAELPALCADPNLVSGHEDKQTVFDSTGFALEDHVALDVLLELAAEYKIGAPVQLEYLPANPLNPYSSPRPRA